MFVELAVRATNEEHCANCIVNTKNPFETGS